MSAARSELSIEGIVSHVSSQLSSSGLSLKPKAVTASPTVDGLGEDAWQLIIVLPKPAGATWDVDEVFRVRRAAVAAFDEAIGDNRLELPGQTLAIVTTDEADEMDVAEDEAFEEHEDPSATSDEDAE